MAIELKFYKTDNSPWGFRLTGGADCDFPLTVVKVIDESIADINGLKVGDVIVRINEHSVADCTHAEVHELISAAGQELIFGIRRDYYSNDEDEEDENNNLEVSNIMNSTFEHEIQATELVDANVVHTNHKSSMSSITDELIAEAISGEAEVLPDQNILGVNFNKVDLSQSTILQVMEQQKIEEAIELQERKWSAFLQKPQRPIVQPKSKNIEQSKASPYQVIIKKQKKKNIGLNRMASLPDPEPEQNENEKHVEIVDNEFQETENVENAEVSETCDNEENLNDEDEDGNSENEIADDDRESIDKNYDSENELTESHETKEETEVHLSVDEQLAQVQMQLQALAQLPSSIQDTLESVTQQLTKILNATQLRIEEEQNLDSAHASRGDSLERSFEENTKEEIEAFEEEQDVANEEEYKSNASDISDQDYSFNDKGEQHVNEITDNDFENEDMFEPEIDEDELERLRIETEKSVQKERNVNVVEESHQRRLEQRPTYPLAPIQRPIILPGGRKWAQPDDAVPVPKKKSGMSDEKICETLDTYSETIIGHTKGLTNGTPFGHGVTTLSKHTAILLKRINFLKYQPPAKNLDYLQKSEVYKLIHDMDPPPRGIATRAEIVIPEQDYYTKGK